MKIEDILKLDDQLTILHGEAGVKRHVAYIDVVEIPEGMHWTNAHDFIITTGYFFATSEPLLELLVRTLIRRRCAGLGIKIGRYLDKIPDSVAKIAEENAFPIIRIPMHFRYREISRPLLKVMMAEGPGEYGFGTERDFFAALLEGTLREEGAIRLNAAKFNIPFGGLRFIIIVQGDSVVDKGKEKDICRAVSQAGQIKTHCFDGERQNTAAILCHVNKFELLPEERKGLIKKIFAAVRRELNDDTVIMSASAPCQNLLQINQAAFQANLLLSLGPRLYPQQKDFLFSNHYLDLFLCDNQTHYVLESLYQIYIAPLEEADVRDNSELLPTLLALCANSFSITQTGQALYLHRNTIYNRIKRIEALIGPIDDFNTRQGLLLVAKHHLIKQAGKEGAKV